MTSPARTTPVGRYGTAVPAGRRRATVAVLAVLAVAGIALVVWLGLGSAAQPVRWTDVGFEVVSPERTDVTFEVTLSPGTTAVCTIDALAPNYSQVGTIDITVGPLEQATARYTVSVATSELATTGVVVGCQPTPRSAPSLPVPQWPGLW